MGEVDVALEVRVDTVATLGSLQIDVGHLGILAHRLPEHLSLIVAQVDAMHMVAGILAQEKGIHLVAIGIEDRLNSSRTRLGLGLDGCCLLLFLLGHNMHLCFGTAPLLGLGHERFAKCRTNEQHH